MNYSDSERLNCWLDKAKRSFWTAVTFRARKTSEKSMVEKSSLRQMIRRSISFDLRSSLRPWSTTRRSPFHEDTLNSHGRSSTARQKHPPTTKSWCQQILIHARIPSEILGLIFLYATEEHTMDGHYSFPAVSQVSRSWRAVSLSIPTLWNNITLDCQQPTSKSKSCSSIVESLIRRTCGATLNVSIRMLLPIKLAALDVLLGTSDRWEVATIEFSPESVTFFSAIRGRLSSLRRLELMLIGRPVANKMEHDMFERAPNLQEAFIQGDWLSVHFSLPWPQLLQFKDSRGNNGGSHDIIRALTSVNKLGITWKSETDELDPGDEEAATLPVLERLDVDFIFLSHQGFFERLILPNIKELNIGNHIGDPIPRLISMFLRSQTTSLLQKLTIYTQFHRPGDLSLLLSLTPQLQELSIWMPDARDLSNLNIQPGVRVLVPELRYVRFITDTTFGLEHHINALAASRCELETYSAGFPNSITQAIRPLSHFSITLRDGHNRFGERENLEHSGFSVDEGQSTLRFLRLCREAIIEAMPWIGIVDIKPRKMAYSAKRLAQLDAIFTALMNWKIEHAGYLYQSHLHITLQFFSRQPSYLTPGGVSYRFQLRASEVLKKWSTCLLEDLHHRHWTVKNDHTLKYVFNDDTLRTSGDALSIIYGPNFLSL